MDNFSLVILSVGLAMDAFAASICKGLQETNDRSSLALAIGICFGLFQGIMPVIGYYLGATFAQSIAAIDHRIAFILLSIIGIQMIKESRIAKCDVSRGFDISTLIQMGIATSIDALAIGVSLAFLKVNIIKSAMVIAIITAALSFMGFKIGNKLGVKSKQRAELAGGIILILMGLRILIGDLFF